MRRVSTSRRDSQKVKKRRSRSRGRQASAREMFVTSREMDFFSEKELITQTGHNVEEWPLVFLKETIDNALDACDDVGTPPIIRIDADPTGISVSDNGPGLPESTLEAARNFSVRASSREAYIAPDRGAQGNALMTLVSMPRVIADDDGELIVTAHGQRHAIRVRADPIAQRPVIDVDRTAVETVGTTIEMRWLEQRDEDGYIVWPFDSLLPDQPDHDDTSVRAHQLIAGFALFNPHADFHVNWFGNVTEWRATDTKWRKWQPSDPTSAHWYDQESFCGLIAACIGRDRNRGVDRTVNKFLTIFDGLKGSAKRSEVLSALDMQRVRLSTLADDDGIIRDRAAKLLRAVQDATTPVTPKRLGVIGSDHFRERMSDLGIMSESFKHRNKLGTDEHGLPFVLEIVFGYCGDSELPRRTYAGVDWSAAIKIPFRSLGRRDGLEAFLTELRAGPYEPIVYCAHLAHPRIPLHR